VTLTVGGRFHVAASSQAAASFLCPSTLDPQGAVLGGTTFGGELLD